MADHLSRVDDARILADLHALRAIGPYRTGVHKPTFSEPHLRSLQWLVQLTPLYHGVALERALMLGDVGWGVLAHVGYLVLLGGIGVIGTARRLEKLLLS